MTDTGSQFLVVNGRASLKLGPVKIWSPSKASCGPTRRMHGGALQEGSKRLLQFRARIYKSDTTSCDMPCARRLGHTSFVIMYPRVVITALAASVPLTAARDVFAHYMVRPRTQIGAAA